MMRSRPTTFGFPHVAAGLLAGLIGTSAGAQAITVLPVTIHLAAGQRTTSLRVVNQGAVDAAFQVRAFSWKQTGTDGETLTPSDGILVSPPLGTIAASTTQVVRIVLRPSAAAKEQVFRLLLDQIPPPAAPGTVRIALRLSIPIFAAPAGRAVPDLHYHVERTADALFLVAVNDGDQHEVLRDIAVTAGDGTVMKTDTGVSPYILAGTTRRWRIGPAGAATGPLRLTAKGETTGAISQAIAVPSAP